MQFSKILQITEGFVLLCLGGPIFLFSVPERGAAALKVTAHCTDPRKRNCLGVPERGRKVLVKAAADVPHRQASPEVGAVWQNILYHHSVPHLASYCFVSSVLLSNQEE